MSSPVGPLWVRIRSLENICRIIGWSSFFDVGFAMATSLEISLVGARHLQAISVSGIAHLGDGTSGTGIALAPLNLAGVSDP